MSMSADILPDCRLRDRRKLILSRAGNWVPVFCANCGRSGGAVPEENMTFMFYLCNYCVESHGAIANTMTVPDEVFWSEVNAQQKVEQPKGGN